MKQQIYELVFRVLSTPITKFDVDNGWRPPEILGVIDGLRKISIVWRLKFFLQILSLIYAYIFSKILEIRIECFIRLGLGLCVDITDGSATSLDDYGSDEMIKAIVQSILTSRYSMGLRMDWVVWLVKLRQGIIKANFHVNPHISQNIFYVELFLNQF